MFAGQNSDAPNSQRTANRKQTAVKANCKQTAVKSNRKQSAVSKCHTPVLALPTDHFRVTKENILEFSDL